MIPILYHYDVWSGPQTPKYIANWPMQHCAPFWHTCFGGGCIRKNADVFYRCRHTKIIPILNNQQVNPFILLARSMAREITRLDIMAYLDPATNPGSKPKRLGATNCKILQIRFEHLEPLLAFLINFWPKTIYMR